MANECNFFGLELNKSECISVLSSITVLIVALIVAVIILGCSLTKNRVKLSQYQKQISNGENAIELTENEQSNVKSETNNGTETALLQSPKLKNKAQALPENQEKNQKKNVKDKKLLVKETKKAEKSNSSKKKKKKGIKKDTENNSLDISSDHGQKQCLEENAYAEIKENDLKSIQTGSKSLYSNPQASKNADSNSKQESKGASLVYAVPYAKGSSAPNFEKNKQNDEASNYDCLHHGTNLKEATNYESVLLPNDVKTLVQTNITNEPDDFPQMPPELPPPFLGSDQEDGSGGENPYDVLQKD